MSFRTERSAVGGTLCTSPCHSESALWISRRLPTWSRAEEAQDPAGEVLGAEWTRNAPVGGAGGLCAAGTLVGDSSYNLSDVDMLYAGFARLIRTRRRSSPFRSRVAHLAGRHARAAASGDAPSGRHHRGADIDEEPRGGARPGDARWKGNQYYFGMKLHIADAQTGVVHSFKQRRRTCTT